MFISKKKYNEAIKRAVDEAMAKHSEQMYRERWEHDWNERMWRLEERVEAMERAKRRTAVVEEWAKEEG